jgi:hypothetical protein
MKFVRDRGLWAAALVALVVTLGVRLADLPAGWASQNPLSSPTTGTVSGLQLTNNYNGALDSVNTCNSGSTAPTNQLTGTPSLGNCWLSTASNPNPVQWYDGSNWLTPFWVDAVNHYTNVKIGGGMASVASAATVDLCASANAPQAYIVITGNVTVTSFGSTCKAGHVKLITFAGALTLTYDPTSLIIPGAASVATAAGDQAIVVALGGGNWQVVSYAPASGQSLVNLAVPVGTVLTFGGYTIPANFVEGYGQAISRTAYPNYLAAVTSVQSVTRTSGSPTLTGFSDTTRFGSGQYVEGAGIPAGSYILSCFVTTCTLNNNASSSGNANATVFLYGDGDGSTTVTVPDCRGREVVYRDNIGGNAAGVSQVYTTINTTSGSTSATVASASGVAAGMYVISPFVPPGTFVIAVVGTTVVLSANATATFSGSGVRFSASLDAQMMGSIGGAESRGLLISELPTITPQGTISGTQSFTGVPQGPGSAGSFSSPFSVVYNNNQTLTVNGANFAFTGVPIGSNAPHLLNTPQIVMTCIVRVSRLEPGHLPRPANDDAPHLAVLAVELRDAA